MQSGTDLPVVAQASAASAAGNPLPGTFLGFYLNLLSDRLYDLDSAIPGVIGLQAIQPDVAVIKVISIPDNRCIRVVIPDDHVPNEFHDMEVEEPRFVALSLISAASVWTGQGPYLHLWDVISQISNGCARSAGSGSDPHNLACVHSVASTFNKMDVAQLWRCPVAWWTVWRACPRTVSII